MEKNTPMTSSEVIKELAAKNGLSNVEVKRFFESLRELITTQLTNSPSRQFVIPGLIKLKTVDKPAVPERKGINPFTKAETVFKAKPAKKTVKASVLKALKNLS